MVQYSSAAPAPSCTSVRAASTRRRNELDVNEGYAVLELHLQKLSKPKSSLEKKRDLDAAFPLSPPHPRPQAEPQK